MLSVGWSSFNEVHAVQSIIESVGLRSGRGCRQWLSRVGRAMFEFVWRRSEDRSQLCVQCGQQLRELRLVALEQAPDAERVERLCAQQTPERRVRRQRRPHETIRSSDTRTRAGLKARRRRTRSYCLVHIVRKLLTTIAACAAQVDADAA